MPVKTHLRSKEMSAKKDRKEEGQKGKVQQSMRKESTGNKTQKPQNCLQTVMVKSYRISREEISLKQKRKKQHKNLVYHFSSRNCIDTVVHTRTEVGGVIVPHLSHAWVVSFVSYEALVDLLSQSSILLWSPWKERDKQLNLAHLVTNYLQCALKDGFHTCGNGLQGIL